MVLTNYLRPQFCRLWLQRAAEVGALLAKEGSSAHRHDSSVNTINFWLPGFVDLKKVKTLTTVMDSD